MLYYPIRGARLCRRAAESMDVEMLEEINAINTTYEIKCEDYGKQEIVIGVQNIGQ
jgi:hypothetical protein